MKTFKEYTEQPKLKFIGWQYYTEDEQGKRTPMFNTPDGRTIVPKREDITPENLGQEDYKKFIKELEAIPSELVIFAK